MIASGIPRRYVQIFGRWKSDCVDLYIEDAAADEAARQWTATREKIELSDSICGLHISEVRDLLKKGELDNEVHRHALNLLI